MFIVPEFGCSWAVVPGPSVFPVRFASLLAICACFTASAQIPSVTDATATPTPAVGHNYIQENVETVNPANGSLSIRIGVPLPPSRGVNIPFNFAYDSGSAYYLTQAPYPASGFAWWTTYTPFSQGGWSYTVPMLSVQDSPFSGVIQVQDGYTETPVTCHMWTDYVFQDGSGQRTNLGISFPENNEGGCNVNNFPNQLQPSYDTPQSSGLVLPLSATTLVSQVGSTIATTNPSWSSEGVVNALDVVAGDGTVYSFADLQAPLTSGYTQSTGIAPPSVIMDRNGNSAKLTPGGNGKPSLTYVDSIGRTSLSISSFAAASDTLTVSGLDTPYQVNWISTAANFPITMTNLAAFDGYSNCPTSNSGGAPVGKVISSIKLPNGQQYGFTYDPTYGLINRINYPTGGYVVYSWGLNPQSQFGKFINYQEIAVVDPISGRQTSEYPNPTGACAWHYDTPALQHRYVYNGGQMIEQQDFAYSTTWDSTHPQYWDQKQTTVTTHDLVQGMTFQTIYTYGSVPPDVQPNTSSYQTQIPVETTIQYYGANGSSGSTGPLLRTVNKVWFNARVMTQQTTNLANGQVSETDWTYNCNEMEIEKDDYDFGAGSTVQTPPANCQFAAKYASGSAPRGPLLRKTLIPSYHNFTGTINGDPQNILDKPEQVIVEDGSSNVRAGVSYKYDPNGNLLSRSDWLDQAGKSVLTTSHTYDLFGNLLTTTDPSSNTTTYGYTDSFIDNCSLPSQSNTYLTKSTSPKTASGVALVKTFQYHCATGDLASSTDENQQVTSYIYNTPPAGCNSPDGLDRISEIDYPDGGRVTHCYNDSAPNPTVLTTTLMNTGGQTKASLTTLDGLGQAIQSQLVSDPEGAVKVDTVYDGVGHVYSVTNPYRASSEPTYGLTTTSYDALGRPVVTTHPDNSTSFWCYDGVASSSPAANCYNHLGSATTGTWVDSTDENGNHWQRTSDALGRLTEVMELGSAGSPLSLETDYGYDALSNLLSVNQMGNGSTDLARVRSFSYDSLSRLIAVNNPETASAANPASLTCTGANGGSWTTCYGYDPNGNLGFKTDNRGITVSYGYDSLNRLVSKSYSDKATPLSCYQYDSSSIQNGVGRLANAWTLSASSGLSCPASAPFLTKRAILNYDAMGRILSEQQFTRANQTTGYSPAYTYDLAGDLLTSTSGVAPSSTVSPIVLTTVYNSAGRLQTVTSNVASNWISGTALPTKLFAPPATPISTCSSQGTQYAAFGGLTNAAVGIGSTSTPAFTLNRSYDIRLRVNCENDMRSRGTAATPGSVIITISGTEQVH